ncbi:permease prefix domain 1-containing protein [Micromonospora sp. NPDC003197]
MSGSTAAPVIDAYVQRLDRALHGPVRLKRDLLTEARHSLLDAAEGYRVDGLPETEAERLAVAEFGAVPALAAEYQAELSATMVRTLALRIFAVWLLLASSADLMWQGAPWSDPRPTTGYLLFSTALNWVWVAAGLLSIASYLWLTWSARQGRPAPIRLIRALGRILAGALGVGCLLGATVYAWSLNLWDSAISWPPMLVGGTVMFAAYAWLAATARPCLAATR